MRIIAFVLDRPQAWRRQGDRGAGGATQGVARANVVCFDYPLNENDQQITQLLVRVDELQTQVVGLETGVAVRDEAIKEQCDSQEDSRREPGTMHYVVGARK